MARRSADGACYDLLGSSLLPYPSGTIRDWPYDVLVIGRTIEQALQATGASLDVVSALVAMSHPTLESETVRASITLADEPITVRAHDMERLKQTALNQVLGIDREALVVEPLGYSGNGFEGVDDPQGLPATRLLGTFHLVTIPMALRRALAQAVEYAGLEVASLTWSLQADAATVQVGDTPGVLLIDVGGLSIDVGLFVHGRLKASQTVPWGGGSLAVELAKSLHVTLEQAQPLILEGLTSRRSEVPQSLERRLDELKISIEQILREDVRPDRIVMMGRGALVDGVLEWVERATGITTSLHHRARPNPVGNLSHQLGLATAWGLVERLSRVYPAPATSPSGLFDRLLHRTKALLTEYF
jgi:hypothetical protein